MSDVTAEQTIEASTQQVWAVLGEGYDRLHDWFPGSTGTDMETEPPFGVGTVRVVRNGPMRIREEIVVWEPGERLGYVITGLGPGARDVRSDWMLHARPDGSTVAQVKTSWEMRGGAVGKLFRPVYSQLLARAGKSLTMGLKQAVEAGPA